MIRTTPPLTARRVVELTGVSYRRIDYWVTGGVLASIGHFRYGANPGSGAWREFTVDHVHALRVCGRLCDLFDSEEGDRSRLRTSTLTRVVEALHDAEWPTRGFLMVGGDMTRWAADVYDLVVALEVDGGPWIVLPLRDDDRPAV